MNRDQLTAFVIESNRIEGIHDGVYQPVFEKTYEAHVVLLGQKVLTTPRLEQFVHTVAKAPLRKTPGMDVRVGNHTPPPGGPKVKQGLDELLDDINSGLLGPYDAHLSYEYLHPFMDGNGRSGRAIWAWQMLGDEQDPFAIPFLHRFYYQTLDASR